MGQFMAERDSYPLEEQIKTLGDEELLDFWEETQHLDRFLEEEAGIQDDSNFEYERLILQELQLRSCLRSLTRS
ncbi:hypothetical protein V6C53_02005 [Desulfocurvibacter africanus]|uniref:hypothetical protein n=1 Tax=Desulfocurvibacter africanus TaxID=873 RepID=UPI002FD9C97F